MNSVVLAVTDNEVTGLFNKLWHFLIKLINAGLAAIGDIPQTVLGWIVVGLIVIWIYKKVVG